MRTKFTKIIVVCLVSSGLLGCSADHATVKKAEHYREVNKTAWQIVSVPGDAVVGQEKDFHYYQKQTFTFCQSCPGPTQKTPSKTLKNIRFLNKTNHVVKTNVPASSQPLKQNNEMVSTAMLSETKRSESPTAIETNKNSNVADWIAQSYASLNSRQWDDAINAASEAIKIDSNIPEPFVNRSWGYAEKGDYNRSIADATRAITIDPNNRVAYNNRAYARELAGDIDRAKADYRKSCELGFKVSCETVAKITELEIKHRKQFSNNILLHTVHFPWGTNLVSDDHRAIIKRLVSTHPNTMLLVTGYTDNTRIDGATVDNKYLAQQRADAIKILLIAEGFPASNIQAQGREMCCYISSNETDAGRSLNRRAEISVIVNNSTKEKSNYVVQNDL
jgi:flagellar motor protein MotB